MQNKFSMYLTGFLKNYSTLHALLKMIKTWKTKLNHELLIAKLKCCGLDQHAVEFFEVNSQIATSAVK